MTFSHRSNELAGCPVHRSFNPFRSEVQRLRGVYNREDEREREVGGEILENPVHINLLKCIVSEGDTGVMDLLNGMFGLLSL